MKLSETRNNQDEFQTSGKKGTLGQISLMNS